MDSVSSVSPTIVLPPPSDPLRPRRLVVSSLTTHHKHHRIPRLFLSSSSRRRRRVLEVSCNWRSSGRFSQQEENSDGDEEEKEKEEVERALHMDGTIPGTSNEFVKQVSSRAYDMRRHLHQTFDSSSYDGIHYTLFFSFSILYFPFYICALFIATKPESFFCVLSK